MEQLAPCWVLLAGTLLSVLATGPARSARDLILTQMDMALESFDDDYEGCVEQMWAELLELNCTEFTHSSVYAEGWRAAAAEWQRRWGGRPHPRQLRQEQAIALLAYTGDSKLFKQFSSFCYEDEVLIPPFEVFKVTEFRRGSSGNVIHLHSNGTQSRHTCELLKGGQRGQGRQEVGRGHSPGWALCSQHSSMLSPHPHPQPMGGGDQGTERVTPSQRPRKGMGEWW
ncbi:GPI-linked NAD(P)(+)--arginine ADP-ribosyltransferase 1 [Cyrtonyx montezumae]|uniref:GPI-linked NAD(P)(+)--arginine ADP-ribosyltransferase 1 n=1 Tax=Cyrtonyx montezumae TaxID=9017 RepID=UPI0032DA7652